MNMLLGKAQYLRLFANANAIILQLQTQKNYRSK